MYAWTNFNTEINEYGQVTGRIKTGEKVTREQLGVTEEQWLLLIQNGQVREQPYPDTPSGVAPSEYFSHLQAKAAKGRLTNREVIQLQDSSEFTVKPDEDKPTTTREIRLPI